MALTTADVSHVARLARLNLSDEEVERMRLQLSDILTAIEALQEVDVSDVPPTAQVFEVTTVMRPDRVTQQLTTEEAFANAPERSGNMFRVKPVFELE